MILDKLLSLDYYTKKLSLSLKNSYGVEDQFAMFVYYLNEIDTALTNLIEQLDINSEETKIDEMLDKIASFYCLSRRLNVSYHKDSTQEDINVSLDLSNDELLMLIKATIIKNQWKGSMQELNELYEKFDLPIFVMTNKNQSANATYYLKVDNPVSENVEHLFYAGFLSVESMGVSYRYNESDDSHYAIWDSTEEKRMWDRGWWL